VLEGQSLDTTEPNNTCPPEQEGLKCSQVTSLTSRGGMVPPLNCPPLQDDFHNYLTLVFTSRSFGQMCFPLSYKYCWQNTVISFLSDLCPTVAWLKGFVILFNPLPWFLLSFLWVPYFRVPHGADVRSPS